MFDLSIVIPALHEAENLSFLLPKVRDVLMPLGLQLEIIIVDEMANDQTHQVSAENNAVLICPPTRGYGKALLVGFENAHANFIVTMDADLSHPPEFLKMMWECRHSADVIIASRYVPNGTAEMPLSRYLLSKTLNIFFSRGLDLNVRDMSSGFRMYARHAIPFHSLEGDDFNVLQELLVRALVEGYTIKEIPFHYEPRKQGSSHARVLKFGMEYLRTFRKLWLLRNSLFSADYDARAANTWVLPQRYWRRMRYKHVTQLAKNKGKCLDIGCGSSPMLQEFPPGSIGIDILLQKLRFARLFQKQLIQASTLSLPIKAETFPCIICSQVIEHVADSGIFNELDRLLEPGGFLIFGTPDYSKRQWVVYAKNKIHNN